MFTLFFRYPPRLGSFKSGVDGLDMVYAEFLEVWMAGQSIEIQSVEEICCMEAVEWSN